MIALALTARSLSVELVVASTPTPVTIPVWAAAMAIVLETALALAVNVCVRLGCQHCPNAADRRALVMDSAPGTVLAWMVLVHATPALLASNVS